MIETFTKEASQRLAEVRKLVKKYQADIADEFKAYSGLDINQSVISNYESGKLRVSFAYLRFLAERYNLNANYILTGKGSVWAIKTPSEVLVSKSELSEIKESYERLGEKIRRIERGY